MDERIVVVRGEGCYIWDAEGNRYLDALSALQVLDLVVGRLPARSPAILDLVYLRERIASLEELNDQGVFERKTLEITVDDTDKRWSVGDRKSVVPTASL